VRNSNVHAILSDVHRLLSQYAPDDFVAASRYSGVSDTIRSVLLALASETGASRQQSVDELRRREDLKRHPDDKRRPSLRQQATRGRILDAILTSPRFANPRAILDYASMRGLKIQAKPKDGKERLARRLVAAIESAPEQVRSDALVGLEREKGNQTQGWIDVIKSART
jgi:hypothetical protein